MSFKANIQIYLIRLNFLFLDDFIENISTSSESISQPTGTEPVFNKDIPDWNRLLSR